MPYSMQQILQTRKSSLLFFSLLFSLCIHAIGLFCLHNRPIYRYTPINTLLKRKEVRFVDNLEIKERQFALKEFFKAYQEMPKVTFTNKELNRVAAEENFWKIKAFPMEENVIAAPYSLQIKESLYYLLCPPPKIKLVQNKREISTELIAVLKRPFSKKYKEDNQNSALPLVQGLPLNECSFQKNFLLQAKEEVKEVSFKAELSPDKYLKSKFSLIECSSKEKNSPSFATLETPSLQELQTVSYNEAFDVDILLLPQENSDKHLFAITLILKPGFNVEGLKENFLFLLDKSNSVQNERLIATKRAIEGALPFLKDEDSFNIISFDNQISVLFKEPLKKESATLKQAKEFLSEQWLGSFFFSANFVPPLSIALKNSDDLNVVVLLSNADSLDKFKSYKVFEEWTERNKGKNALFALSMEGDPNLTLMEYFTFLNKGNTCVSTTKTGLKKQLQTLIKGIRSPIGKDLSIKLVPCTGDKQVELYTPKTGFPLLYADQPYVILGSVEKPSDFFLFLQGRGKKGWFNIKKKISFLAAKKGGKELEKQWALQRAYKCYEKFIADGNKEHLKEARGILEPFDRF